MAKKRTNVQKAMDEALANRASDVVKDKALMETLKRFGMPFKSKGDPKYKEKNGIFLREESRGRPKEEMDYFDCPFSNDVDFDDFSKEFLVKLLKNWMNWYISMAMIWWTKTRMGWSEKVLNEHSGTIGIKKIERAIVRTNNTDG